MFRPLSLCLAALITSQVLAAEPVQYNLISLSAEAHREVQNDLARAVLYVEYSDASAASLSDKLNRSLAGGLRVAKGYPQVKVAVGGNQVYPVYNRNNKAEGWRGRAELRLESTDLKAVAELVGKLQNDMQLANVGFAVSPALREQVETALMTEAMQAFRDRAEVVRKGWGGKSYRLVNMTLNTQDVLMPQAPMMAKAMLRAEAADVAPPMESGQSMVAVNVQGTVQIAD